MRAERAKGARGELEVVGLVQAAGWPMARRTHDGREQALRGDIANGPAGVHLEVKRTERASVWSWWARCRFPSFAVGVVGGRGAGRAAGVVRGEGAIVSARVCECGCGASLDGRHPSARFATAACRARSWKERTGYDRAMARNAGNGGFWRGLAAVKHRPARRRAQ